MTKPVPGDAQTLQQWLVRQPRSVAGVLDRAQQLAEINRALHEWCSEPWIAHVRVANLRDGVLVVFSPSAASLVPLRHRSASLLAFLNQRFALNCRQIEAKVRPDGAR